MSEMLGYLRWPIGVTVLGMIACAFIGWQYTSSASGALQFLFIGAVLAVLEISLSFDNAIVNANKLEQMEPKWQQRFLTWGILIAVFGMRIIFPLLIVVVAAHVNPIEAVRLAAMEPGEYARIMDEAHGSIAAFGGTFLMLVGLTYFIDAEKDVHWWRGFERLMASGGAIRGLEVAVVLIPIIVLASVLPPEESQAFLYSAVCGLITFVGTEVLGRILDHRESLRDAAVKGGVGAFIYLEVLDASFSFDGVIGAFALTQNLFLIAIGLGIGAFYVRSMTIMLVEKKTLAKFRYLEHGAFWSILALSVVMFSQTLVHIPEVITGLAGATLIGLSLWSSIAWNRTERRAKGAGRTKDARAQPAAAE